MTILVTNTTDVPVTLEANFLCDDGTYDTVTWDLEVGDIDIELPDEYAAQLPAGVTYTQIPPPYEMLGRQIAFLPVTPGLVIRSITDKLLQVVHISDYVSSGADATAAIGVIEGSRIPGQRLIFDIPVVVSAPVTIATPGSWELQANLTSNDGSVSINAANFAIYGNNCRLTYTLDTNPTAIAVGATASTVSLRDVNLTLSGSGGVGVSVDPEASAVSVSGCVIDAPGGNAWSIAGSNVNFSNNIILRQDNPSSVSSSFGTFSGNNYAGPNNGAGVVSVAGASNAFCNEILNGNGGNIGYIVEGTNNSVVNATLRHMDTGVDVQPSSTGALVVFPVADASVTHFVTDLGANTSIVVLNDGLMSVQNLAASGNVSVGGALTLANANAPAGVNPNLEWYGSGLWVPSLNMPGATLSYATQQGSWVRVGDLLFFTLSITATPTWSGSPSSAALQVTGLPFGNSVPAYAVAWLSNPSGGFYSFYATVSAGTLSFDGIKNGTQTSITNNNFGDGQVMTVDVSGCYFTNGLSLVPPPTAIGTPMALAFDTLVATDSGSPSAVTTADVPAGQLVVVAVMATTTAGDYVSALTDSAGNTYTQAVRSTLASGDYNTSLYYCIDALELPIGTTFTATTNLGGQWNIANGGYVSGANGGIDKTSYVTGTGTGVSLSVGGLSTSVEIAFAAVQCSDTVTSWTESSTFTELGVTPTSIEASGSDFAYHITSSPGGINYSVNWTTSRTAVALLATFKLG